MVASILVILCGRWWWSLALPAPGPLAALLAVASISLAALGVAIATFIHRPENAPAATNALLWPVAFISGTFTLVPAGSLLDRVAQLLPVRHLNQAAFAAMHPDGGTIHTGSLLVVAAWGVIGLAIAAARCSWEPSTTARPLGGSPRKSALAGGVGHLQSRRGRSRDQPSSPHVARAEPGSR